MKLFVGLGNPGKIYSKNRHNIGFNVIDKLLESLTVNYEVRWNNRFDCHFFIIKIGTQKILFAKPQTFMNLSGNPVYLISKFFKVSNKNIYVFHDELDLPLGKIKLKFDGGHAGHNGIKSIHNFIGSDYYRVRIGINHPGKKELVSGYVLSNFEEEEENILKKSIFNLSKHINLIIDDKIKDFENFF